MAKATTIKNVHVFSETGLSDLRTVYVTSEGLIGGDNAPAGRTEIDGEGGILMPGFIDAHVHVYSEDQLHKLARYGVTTGLDMACWPPETVRSLRNHEACDIRSAGIPATVSGSMHSLMLPLPNDSFLSKTDEAEKWVEQRIQEGSDYIKLISDIPGPSQELLNALTDAAHRRGKPVVAHAANLAPFQMAVEAKADILTHTPTDQTLDPDTVSKMVDRIAVPTLTMMEAKINSRPSWWTIVNLLLKPISSYRIIQTARSQPFKVKDYRNAKDSVTAMYQAGVPILAGTDCHEVPSSPVFVPHGDSLHHELELLVDAGLSTMDTLRAATSLPAKHFGLSDRGVIEEGKRADLVLLSEDPLRDIRATRKIKRVWCKGVEIEL